MEISTTDKELIHYFTQLEESQKKSIIEMIKSFLKPSPEAMNKITIEEYNREIDEAVARVERGEFYTQQEVEKMAKDW